MKDLYCKLCGFEFDESNYEESVESHLREKHFMTLENYIYLLKSDLENNPNISCWKCGSPRYTLSTFLDSCYLHCMKCGNGYKEMKSTIEDYILKYQTKIGKNKFYQLFLASDDKFRNNFYPRSFEKISELLGEIKTENGIRIEKTNTLFLKNIPGTLPEISERNKKNLYLETSETIIKKISQDCFRLDFPGRSLYLFPPENVPFDYRHHSRHSILNQNSKRKTKRIKLDSGECFKFWNTPLKEVRSIFSLRDDKGENVCFSDLSNNCQFMIKSEILKTKELREKIFSIYNETIKYASGIKDGVFLFNSLNFPWNVKLGRFIFSWNYIEQEYNPSEETINISIL